jgi:hypothetical protein
MNHQLETDYAGVSLRLDYSDPADVHLYINGVHRDEAKSDSNNITLRLASPLQTGYEQHEFIEVMAVYTPTSISVRLSSADQLIAEQQVNR